MRTAAARREGALHFLCAHARCVFAASGSRYAALTVRTREMSVQMASRVTSHVCIRSSHKAGCSSRHVALETCTRFTRSLPRAPVRGAHWKRTRPRSACTAIHTHPTAMHAPVAMSAFVSTTGWNSCMLSVREAQQNGTWTDATGYGKAVALRESFTDLQLCSDAEGFSSHDVYQRAPAHSSFTPKWSYRSKPLNICSHGCDKARVHERFLSGDTPRSQHSQDARSRV